MTRRTALGAALLLLLAGVAGAEEKKPFYRSYLVAGNPLDDRILAQEKRVEADPGSASLRNDFGNLLAARRLVGDARKQYKEAMKLDKTNFLAPYNLGLLEETEGRSSAAIDAYQASIKRKPGFPHSRFHLGLLYEKRGWTQRAIEQFARALQIDASLRNPRRNPPAADTRLLDRVSLTNYQRDLAVAAMNSETRWSDEGRFVQTPADRALNSDDVSEAPPTSAMPAPGRAGSAPPSTPSTTQTPAALPASSTSSPPARAAPPAPAPTPTSLPRAPMPAGVRPFPPPPPTPKA